MYEKPDCVTVNSSELDVFVFVRLDMWDVEQYIALKNFQAESNREQEAI